MERVILLLVKERFDVLLVRVYEELTGIEFWSVRCVDYANLLRVLEMLLRRLSLVWRSSVHEKNNTPSLRDACIDEQQRGIASSGSD